MELTREEIMEIMPHRDPMLLIDRVEDLVPGESCTGYFYVKPEMEIFKGHFPGNPVLPGVYQLEAMGQACNIAVQAKTKYEGMTGLFLGCNGASFKKMVRPGDMFVSKARVLKIREDKLIFTTAVEAYVNGELVSTAEFVTAMR